MRAPVRRRFPHRATRQWPTGRSKHRAFASDCRMAEAQVGGADESTCVRIACRIAGLEASRHCHTRASSSPLPRGNAMRRRMKMRAMRRARQPGSTAIASGASSAPMRTTRTAAHADCGSVTAVDAPHDPRRRLLHRCRQRVVRPRSRRHRHAAAHPAQLAHTAQSVRCGRCDARTVNGHAGAASWWPAVRCWPGCAERRKANTWPTPHHNDRRHQPGSVSTCAPADAAPVSAAAGAPSATLAACPSLGADGPAGRTGAASAATTASGHQQNGGNRSGGGSCALMASSCATR